MRVITNDTID